MSFILAPNVSSLTKNNVCGKLSKQFAHKTPT